MAIMDFNGLHTNSRTLFLYVSDFFDIFIRGNISIGLFCFHVTVNSYGKDSTFTMDPIISRFLPREFVNNFVTSLGRAFGGTAFTRL